MYQRIIHVLSSFRPSPGLGWLALLLLMPAAARAQGEFSAGGYDFMRVESEIKLAVPMEIRDSVWKYLTTRYNNEDLFMRAIDSSFRTTQSEDHFLDQYFDDAHYNFLRLGNGVRHRHRVVLTDSTNRKNGRELVQIKVDNVSSEAVRRGEYKYPVAEMGFGDDKYDDHPLLGLVHPDHRAEVIARISEFDVDPLDMAPTIKLEQIRQRVYVLLGDQPFSTMTLDYVRAYYRGDTTEFLEMEMELNEIGFTESDAVKQKEMEALNESFKGHLLQTFPQIKQDQTPKYNKAANAMGVKPGRNARGGGRTNIFWYIGGVAGLLLLLGLGAAMLRKHKPGIVIQGR